MSFTGFAIIAIFFKSSWIPKPIMKVFRACRITFSKHPWSCLHTADLLSSAGFRKISIFRKMDFFLGFFNSTSSSLVFLLILISLAFYCFYLPHSDCVGCYWRTTSFSRASWSSRVNFS
jgi:hypothetical protein